MCSTLAAMVAAPVFGAGAAVEATVSAAMGNFNVMMEAQLAGLTPDDDGADADVNPQAAQLERGADASLREFIRRTEDTARLEIADAKRRRRAVLGSSDFVFFAQKIVRVQRPAGDAPVQWVLTGQERACLTAMGSAPHA